MKKILVISGGGMRGVIPAYNLCEIERATGCPVNASFDMFAGTSTGGILAALCVSPDGPSAAEMLEFYYESGPRIFPRRWFNPGLIGPKYRQEDLQRELRKSLGEHTCGKAKKKLLVASVELERRAAWFFKSWNPYWADFPIWTVAAASASAQSYFPSCRQTYRWSSYRFLDGGNHSNNPTTAAITEAWALWPGEDLLVVSLGTGRQLNPKPFPEGGILQVAPPTLDLMGECQDDCARYFGHNAPRVTFFSFNVDVPKFPGLDDARKATLDRLVGCAKQAALKNVRQFHKMLEALES